MQRLTFFPQKCIDVRTQTPVMYAQVSIGDYLDLVGDSFDGFEIQRGRENHKAYGRMKQDIKDGALLPPITLSVALDYIETSKDFYEKSNYIGLENLLFENKAVNILDGLQRTFILKDIADSGHSFHNDQKLHLEIRFERDIKNLIYRIIFLNAGQKQMSMRHQIDILFSALKKNFEDDIYGLHLIPERESGRRTSFGKYQLAHIASAYYAYVNKDPEVDKQNLVAQKIADDGILSKSESELSQSFDGFKSFVSRFIELDKEIARVYDGTLSDAPEGLEWFGSDNVMQAFFAAISSFGSSAERLDRVHLAINKLKESLENSQPGDDPMGLVVYLQVSKGANSRKVNMGTNMRKIMFNVFKEYFRESGENNIYELWAVEA